MTTIDIKLSLPDSVAKDAASYGLLTPQAMAALLGEAVRQRRVNRLFEAMEKLSAANIPPMTPEEIEAEIKAARQDSPGSWDAPNSSSRSRTQALRSTS